MRHFGICTKFPREAIVSTIEWVALTPENEFLAIVETRRPRSRCWQDLFLLRPLSLICR